MSILLFLAEQDLLVVILSGVKSLSDVGEILGSVQDDMSPKAGRCDKQNVPGAAALRRRVSGGIGVSGKYFILWGRRGCWWLVGRGEGGVQWDIEGLKTSHFESFQSWTLRNVSHFETFEAWRPYKVSHFESFRGWGPYKASHFESSGGCRLREVSHGESFCGPGAVWPSAWGGAGERGRFCGAWIWAWCLAGRRPGVGFAGARAPVVDGTDMP